VDGESSSEGHSEGHSECHSTMNARERHVGDASISFESMSRLDSTLAGVFKIYCI